jgi:small GTP-binding protein
LIGVERSDMSVMQKKVCLLGDFAVGKTSLVRRFVEGRFDDRYLSTIGVKISRKSVARRYGALNLLIWDLAGGEDFDEVSTSYLRGAAGALIVCDLTRRETLPALERLTARLRAVTPDAAIVYLGNKVDLVDERAIADAEAQAVCAGLGGPCLLTSARTGENVEDAFLLLANRLEAST